MREGEGGLRWVRGGGCAFKPIERLRSANVVRPTLGVGARAAGERLSPVLCSATMRREPASV